MSLGATGEAKWYCREHWERLHDREPFGVGNTLPVVKSRGMERFRGWVWDGEARKLVPETKKREAA
jgi:hypothetical protein